MSKRRPAMHSPKGEMRGGPIFRLRWPIGGPSDFIRVFNEDLEVNLEGDNYLICPGDSYCIYNGEHKVVLGTTSTTPTTLVLRSKGNSNSGKGFHTATCVTAATGCTVTPPDDDAYVDNGDGTYTWMWTVVKD